MSAQALPGVAPARQPYPGGAERHVPIVPSVLIIGERRNYYLPPALIRATAIYDTPTTVRLQLPATGKGSGRQETQVQHKVWAVPDDAAWAEIEAAVAAFGARLEDLANLLRRLGSYPKRLAEAGKNAANPLCMSVARIDDPDKRNPTTWWLSAWHVPRLERAPIERHTPKMLSGGGVGSYTFSQEGCFVLADDAAWAELEAAHQAAEQAAKAVEQLLQRLGTYAAAADGRHAARLAPAAPAEASPEKALTIAEPAIDGIVVMSRAEAEEAEARLIATAEDLRKQIDDFDQRRGWEALGYDSFRAWAQVRFPNTSLPTVYRQRDAALVDRDLGVPVGTTPESHARELKHVPSPERPATMQRAEELAQQAGRPRQASDVRQAAQEQRGVANGNTGPALPAQLAAVAEALRRGDTTEGYAGARAAGPASCQAFAAVDAIADGRPLEEAMALLTAPAGVVAIQTKDGPRKVPALRVASDLALTLVWGTDIPGTLPRLMLGRFGITHKPTGLLIGGKVFKDRAEVDQVFDQVVRLDFAGVGPGKPMPIPLAERVARIFGVSFPPVEVHNAANTRANALGAAIHRTSQNGVSGAPYILWFDGGRRETFEEWAALCARLDELERPAAPPPASEAAQALEAMVAETRADLIARAAAVGYSLAWHADGSARFVQTATGAPFGGASDLGEALKRVENLERRAAEEAQSEQQATSAAEAAPAAEAPTAERGLFDQVRRVLRAELAQASPRLKRLLRVAWAYSSEAPIDEGELEGVFYDWLLGNGDGVLVWASAERATATFTAPDELLGIAALDELQVELLVAEQSGPPPDAGDVARWQDVLDAHAEALDDETYQRLAHQIGELRAAAQEVGA